MTSADTVLGKPNNDPPFDTLSSLIDSTSAERTLFEARLALVIPREPRSLYEPVRHVVAAGGKRVRPMLTALAYKLSRHDDEWIDAAVAIELLHTFTLVHDDIMDNAATRRGMPTVHAKFGTNEAILSGDVMIALAQQALSDHKGEHACDMLREFSQGFIKVCEGQAFDKDFEQRNDVTLEDYINMIDLKTAKVLETAAVLGALAAGKLSHVEPLRTFAHHVGLAFQIQDDLLDLTAGTAEFGKAIGGDILEGKRTYLMLKLIERQSSLKGEERQRIDRVLARNATNADIEVIRSTMREAGVLQETEAAVQQHTDLALQALGSIDADTTKLREFAEWLLKRSY
ncbi:MAG TPA: polyprenyl synthetase family protein [Candidatus Kapabacteria bacterium]|jgi:geranylgeranyl diphosphate synthase type II|nr:polyprenyl synthetase family protein [Candidatus Kapabacteria bacterium]